MDALFDELRKSNYPLIIHFDSGLTSQKEREENTLRLNASYRSANLLPVFFHWEQGISEYLTHNLSQIWGEDIFRRVRERILRFVMEKQMRATGRPPLDESIIAEELSKPRPFASFAISREENAVTPTLFEDEDVKAAIEEDATLISALRDCLPPLSGSRVAEPTMLSSHLISNLVPLQEQPSVMANRFGGFVAAALGKIYSRFKNQTDNGLYTTVVEEILREFYGEQICRQQWQSMKKDTREACSNHENSVVEVFLPKLREVLNEGKKIRLGLFGHSLGASYVLNFIKCASPQLPGTKFNVVLSAPACTIAEFFDVIMEHDDSLSSVRVFGLQDNLESSDSLMPEIAAGYPHSILCFASSLFETAPDTPLLGMQRYFVNARYDGMPAVRNVKAFFQPGDLTWTPVSNPPLRSSNATTHRSFETDAETLASLQNIFTKQG